LLAVDGIKSLETGQLGLLKSERSGLSWKRLDPTTLWTGSLLKFETDIPVWFLSAVLKIPFLHTEFTPKIYGQHVAHRGVPACSKTPVNMTECIRTLKTPA
jgi:hypothetical protein